MTASPFNARRLEEQALALFERSHAAMIITDDDRRFVAANDAACEMLRVPRDHLIGRRADDFVPPERFDDYIRLYRAVQEEGMRTGRFRIVAANGEALDLEYSAAANVMPGRTLSIMLPSDPEEDPPAGPARERPALTPREREVLALVARGLTTDDIAGELVISAETVRSHVRNALAALGARTRAHAISVALAHDLLDADLDE